MRFLSYDSPFMTKFRHLVDYILLGLLWLTASVPVVTFGAASTAALYTAEKAVRLEQGKLLPVFWRTFRQEFKQATVLGLLQVAFIALVILDILLVNSVRMPWVVLMVIALVSMLILCWMQLWFGYLSRFNDATKVILSNTFRMTLDSAPKTLLLALLSLGAIGAAVLCILLFSPLTLLIPGVYIMLTARLQRWIFGKYSQKDQDVQKEE